MVPGKDPERLPRPSGPVGGSRSGTIGNDSAGRPVRPRPQPLLHGQQPVGGTVSAVPDLGEELSKLLGRSDAVGTLEVPLNPEPARRPDGSGRQTYWLRSLRAANVCAVSISSRASKARGAWRVLRRTA